MHSSVIPASARNTTSRVEHRLSELETISDEFEPRNECGVPLEPALKPTMPRRRLTHPTASRPKRQTRRDGMVIEKRGEEFQYREG